MDITNQKNINVAAVFRNAFFMSEDQIPAKKKSVTKKQSIKYPPAVTGDEWIKCRLEEEQIKKEKEIKSAQKRKLQDEKKKLQDEKKKNE